MALSWLLPGYSGGGGTSDSRGMLGMPDTSDESVAAGRPKKAPLHLRALLWLLIQSGVPPQVHLLVLMLPPPVLPG